MSNKVEKIIYENISEKNSRQDVLIALRSQAETIADLVAALELAIRYLENPEVQALPFAMPANVPVQRAKDAIRRAAK